MGQAVVSAAIGSVAMVGAVLVFLMRSHCGPHALVVERVDPQPRKAGR